MAAMESYGNIWLLRSNGASPEVWQKIANVKSFNGPNQETSFNESTDFDSQGGKREYRPGLTDPGTLDLTVNYLPGAPTWGILKAQQGAKESARFRLVSCDADAGTRECEEFTAFVQTRGRSAEVDGFMEGNISLRITGDTDETAPAYPTITVEASAAEIDEGGNDGTFTITLSHVDGKDTEIALAWTGTATNVTEYTRPAAATVTIPAGETTATVEITSGAVAADKTVILTIDAEIDGHALEGTLSDEITIAMV